jgi:predicted nucleic acid-binding protein
MTNDTLIAIGAATHGLTLLTANRKDFARLNEFVPFRWELL